MIDINELRMVLARHGTSVLNEDEALELLDRLEAAESDALEQARLNGMGASREAALMAKLEAAEKERDNLRAKIEAMEKQGTVGTLHDDGYFTWNCPRPHESNYAGWKMALYAQPGAQPAPSIPEGWKLVPIEPAEVMLSRAAAESSCTCEEAFVVWEAMLAAAPETKP